MLYEFIYILYSLEFLKDKVEPHAMYNGHGIFTLTVCIINTFLNQPIGLKLMHLHSITLNICILKNCDLLLGLFM